MQLLVSNTSNFFFYRSIQTRSLRSKGIRAPGAYQSLEKIHLWARGGRPDALSWRVTVWPIPTRGGMLELRIFGSGSSTTTVWVVVVHPVALQACRVTCLVPGVEKVMVGLSTVEVPDWAQAFENSNMAIEKSEALRPRDCTRGYDLDISSSRPHLGALSRPAFEEPGGGCQPHPPPSES